MKILIINIKTAESKDTSFENSRAGGVCFYKIYCNSGRNMLYSDIWNRILFIEISGAGNKMKIVVAMDSYKGCCSAAVAGAAVCRGILRADPTIEAINLPVSDGGDGMLEAFLHTGRGKWTACEATGPMGDRVPSGFAILNDRVAIIEMSAASGLALTKPETRNPELATTYGTGELVRAALDAGCREFLIGLGGSATNDGGAGMAQALGVSLRDAAGNELPFGGAALERLCAVDVSGMDPRLADCRVTVASDVQNVLCGPQGASRVYGPQKGATPEMAERLDRALLHYAETLRAQLGADVANRPGAGAAGGLGAALYAFMNAHFRRGIDVVLELQDFAGQVQNADLVITGEGRTDGQTLFGKVPMGVAETAKRQGDIPVCVFSGGVSTVWTASTPSQTAPSRCRNRPLGRRSCWSERRNPSSARCSRRKGAGKSRNRAAFAAHATIFIKNCQEADGNGRINSQVFPNGHNSVDELSAKKRIGRDSAHRIG